MVILREDALFWKTTKVTYHFYIFSYVLCMQNEAHIYIHLMEEASFVYNYVNKYYMYMYIIDCIYW